MYREFKCEPLSKNRREYTKFGIMLIEAKYADEGLCELIRQQKGTLSSESITELRNLLKSFPNKLEHTEDQSNVLIVIFVEDTYFKIKIGEGRNRLPIYLPETGSETKNQQSAGQSKDVGRSENNTDPVRLTRTINEETGTSNTQIVVNTATGGAIGGLSAGAVYYGAAIANPVTCPLAIAVGTGALVGSAILNLRNQPMSVRTCTECLEIPAEVLRDLTPEILQALRQPSRIENK